MNSNKSKEAFKKNGIIALLIIIVFGLVSLIIYNELSDNNSKLVELDELSYKENTFFNIDITNDIELSTGVVELTGYAEVVNRQVENIPDDSYVFFHITNSSSNDFLQFLDRMVKMDKFEFFTRENAIGLGCLKDNIISMVRYADMYSDDEELSILNLSLEDSQSILNSSKDKPVKIIIRKDLDTSLIYETPRCTTLITGVELVK